MTQNIIAIRNGIHDDPEGIDIVQFIDGLANALLTMQYVMDPDCFVLGGGITSWSELLPELKAHIDHLVEWRDGVLTPNVRLCTHRNDANILGAVYHLKLRYGL
jgi:predicted NBD/HSP70 family sugar kinase